MSFSMSDEHFRYAVQISASDPATEQFLAQLTSGGAADAARQLRGIRDSLFATHSTDDFPAEYVRILKNAMLRIVTFAFSGLYMASGERVPQDFWETLDDHMSDYTNPEVVQRRHDRFASLGGSCHTLLISCVDELGFQQLRCAHSVGIICALTDAWVTAYDSEEARKAHQAAAAQWAEKGISSSVAESLLEALGDDDEEREARG